MTTATLPTRSVPALARPDTHRPLFSDVVRSEWLKLRSVRSTYWTLLVTALAMIGLGALFCATFVSHHDGFDLIGFNATAQSLGGFFLAQLAVGVLGVLVMSSEYSTGSIRSTLTSVPQRHLVLAAKAVVFFSVTAAVAIPTAFISWFAGQAILSGKGFEAHLGDPGVIRSIVGIALYLAVLGLLALGLGTMLRRTAGAIAAVVFLVLLLPGIVAALPQSWQTSIDPYLPSYAGAAIMGPSRLGPSNVLGPWAGFALFCGYALVSLLGAAYVLHRRDA